MGPICSFFSLSHRRCFSMCIENNGNAIKPSNEFDARLKKGVGLNIDVDIDFVKSNEVTPAFLNEHIVTEVLISYISVNLVWKELSPRNIFSITRTRAKATLALACQKRLCVRKMQLTRSCQVICRACELTITALNEVSYVFAGFSSC